MIVKSSYKPVVIFCIALISLIFFSIACIMLKKGSSHLNFIRFAALLEIIIPVALTILYFQVNPRIEFDDEFITEKKLFTTNVYDWRLATDVSYSTKEKNLFYGYSAESTVIYFISGERFILWAGAYQNDVELRNLIKNKLKGKINDSVNEVVLSDGNLFQHKKYAGNPFMTIYSFSFILIFITGLLEGAQKRMPFSITLFTMVVFSLLVFLAFSNQMNYFVLDGGILTIRNHYFFWKNKPYPLRFILEVSIEQNYKRSTSLRILTKELDTKSYCADSLLDKQWRELRDDLTLIGIPVEVNTNIG